ncbi:MAG: transglycosylase family protein [Acidimicrobiales bacterium]
MSSVHAAAFVVAPNATGTSSSAASDTLLALTAYMKPVPLPPPPRPHETAAPVTRAAYYSAPSGGVWFRLRECESSDNYRDDTGNSYYGAYQFSLSTWRGLGYSGLPSAAAPAVQDAAAQRLQAERGWSQWPVCAARLGL